jgi:mannose-6-phosphate isomerase-like protein (cupin superfamily)
MADKSPYVVHWGDIPLDMTSIIGKFKRSEFNSIYTNPKLGVSIGHWIVEDGYEDYGEHPQAEIFYIVEGYARVETDEGDFAVGPGDTVLFLPGRRARFVVGKPMKVFYASVGAEDILKMQTVRREAARQR